MQKYAIELNSQNEPTISGSGVTVAHILERLDSGDSIEKICIEDGLAREQVHAALSYAETILPKHKMDEGPYPAPSYAAPEDDLDYRMLIDNAGYFSPASCSLHLVHAFRKRTSRNFSAARHE
jgi:uncharacterized protein DUF433